MLLRGMTVAVAFIAGAALTLELTSGEAAVPAPGDNPEIRYGTAPLSIGNPATALASLGEGRPGAGVITMPFDGSAAQIAPTTYTTPFTVKSGDTLGRILKRAGTDARTADAAVRSLKGVFNPRRLKVGQTLNITYAATPVTKPSGDDSFVGFEIELDYATRVRVSPAPDGGFQAAQVERDLKTEHARAFGNIDVSLFASGSRAGAPNSVMAELVRTFSWDVDFQRDIRKGDAFEVMYERKLDERGEVVHNGRIVFASLTLSGSRKPIYLHQLADGNWDYFDDKGQSAKKALMRTPIDGARLSSHFGKRRHPVLGYTKMHKGTDFAAPPGTPIYAAGDGTIEMSGWNGSFGKYVRIRHNSEYSTAYAHMKSIKRGTTKGARVRQGQVIGYVGTTGRSTGPHLHYEIMRRGGQVNPMRVKMPSGKKLKGEELQRFVASRDAAQSLWASLELNGPQLAAR
ncbi:peptidoglycan DD-metalloendopeptidase family protein [Pseudomonadota bacterium]